MAGNRQTGNRPPEAFESWGISAAACCCSLVVAHQNRELTNQGYEPICASLVTRALCTSLILSMLHCFPRIRTALLLHLRLSLTGTDKKLYVSGVPLTWAEGDVNTLFGTYGSVTACSILKDKASGQSKGFLIPSAILSRPIPSPSHCSPDFTPSAIVFMVVSSSHTNVR